MNVNWSFVKARFTLNQKYYQRGVNDRMPHNSGFSESECRREQNESDRYPKWQRHKSDDQQESKNEKSWNRLT